MLTRRKTMQPERQAKPSREERCAALLAGTVRPIGAAVMATAASLAGVPVAPAAPRLPRAARTHQALRDSAAGQPCRMRLAGCPGDPAMTIWSHCRHAWAGKGGAIKAIDVLGADTCTHCDAIYDGQRPRPAGLTAEAVELAWWRAHAESLVDRARKGLL